jgi:hypothetical protein
VSGTIAIKPEVMEARGDGVRQLENCIDDTFVSSVREDVKGAGSPTLPHSIQLKRSGAPSFAAFCEGWGVSCSHLDVGSADGPYIRIQP